MKQLKIGDKTTSIPIIQGGMGVGVSLSGLASAVANNGGIGIISGVQIGFREEDFYKNTKEANLRALRKEIQRAKSLSPNGIIGVNLMVAIENYADMVKTAVEEKIDLIISGAGLPKELPELVKGSLTKIAPIVSSGKAAAVISKLWKKRYSRLPDLIILEGPLAGGHLGFSKEELVENNQKDLKTLLRETIEAMKPFQPDEDPKIPIVVAGGIYGGYDIKEFLDLGADGVQMGTRFVATDECDADIGFKQAYLKSKQEDIDYIESPVGMPGQAIINPFIERINKEREDIKHCYRCLKACNPKTAPYCITNALINSVKGDVDNGLVFIGKKGYLLDSIVPVKTLMEQLKNEMNLA